MVKMILKTGFKLSLKRDISTADKSFTSHATVVNPSAYLSNLQYYKSKNASFNKGFNIIKTMAN